MFQADLINWERLDALMRRRTSPRLLREVSSSPEELPRQALTDPYVNLSIHTALVIQPEAIPPPSSDTADPVRAPPTA